MKMFFIILFVFPLYLFANNQDVQENYDQGLKAYEAKDYSKAYTFFKKIYLKKLGDPKFNYYFGKSAYETGEYETALGAFERVDIQSPRNLANKIEMARTYTMLKMYEDAENIYADALDNPNLPQNIRTNIEIALSRVSKVQKKSFTYATVVADMIYDSNLNYTSMDDYTFAGLNLPRGNQLSDTALQLFANIVNIYDIGRKNGFAIKNSASVYYKNYSNDKNNLYNVLYLGYTPSLIYKETLFTTELVLGLDRMDFSGKKYLTSAYLMPRFEYNHESTLRSLVHLKYQQKKFALANLHDLDANRLEFSYGLQSILTPRSYVQGNIDLVNEKNVRGSNIYVNYDEAKFSTSYANQFTTKYSFDLYGQVRSKRYKDFSNGFGSTRKDTAGTGSIGFTMLLMPKLRLKLSTRYEYIKSNQARFSYKKNVTSAGIVKTF